MKSGERPTKYWGVWKMRNYKEEVFFLDVKERHGRHTTGTILDCNGVANFEGIFTLNRVDFRKKYIPAESSELACSHTILYEGSPVNGVFQGDFYVEKEHRGSFDMEPVPLRSEIVKGLEAATMARSKVGLRLRERLALRFHS